MRHRLAVAAVMVGLGHCNRQRFRAVARRRRALAEAELLRSPVRTKTKAAKVASPQVRCIPCSFHQHGQFQAPQHVTKVTC
jgi:hypothetical protein